MKPWTSLVLEVGAPFGAYVVAAHAAHDQRIGLIVSAGVAVAVALGLWLGGRRRGTLPAVLAVGMLAALVASLLSGDARALLVREAWVGFPVSVALLVSLGTRAPAFNDLYRALLGVAAADDQRWRRLIAEPAFRRCLARQTAIWGIVGLAGSTAQVVTAWTLSINQAVLAANLSTVGIVVLASLLTAPGMNQLKARVAAAA